MEITKGLLGPMTDDNLPDVAETVKALKSIAALAFNTEGDIIFEAATLLESLSARVTQAERTLPDWEYATVVSGFGLPAGTVRRRRKAVPAGSWEVAPLSPGTGNEASE